MLSIELLGHDMILSEHTFSQVVPQTMPTDSGESLTLKQQACEGTSILQSNQLAKAAAA